MPSRRWTVAVALFLLPVAARGDYTPTDLFVTYGVSPVAFNAASQFAGTEGGPFIGTAYRWTLTDGSGSLEPLGTLGGATSTATAINAGGAVAGFSNPTGSTVQRAFLWTPADGIQGLGTLGGANSFAAAVNAAGLVAGSSQNAAGDTRAFVGRPGVELTDLGTLGGPNSTATGINDAGVVVGSSDTRAGGQTRAFALLGGTLTDLGSLGGAAASSRALGVNNSNVVVGQSDSDGGPTAFLWTQADGFQNLGGLGGVSSAALAVNDAGIVVGTAFGSDNLPRAWVWDATNGLRDLNDLIEDDQDYVLTEAFAINADGQILAYGQVGDIPRVILLDPTGGGTDPNPIPTPAGLPLAAAAAVLLVARKRMKMSR